MSISVSIVEDDAGVRGSLAKLIGSAPGFRCVSEHATAESALLSSTCFWLLWMSGKELERVANKWGSNHQP